MSIIAHGQRAQDNKKTQNVSDEVRFHVASRKEEKSKFYGIRLAHQEIKRVWATQEL